MPRFRPIKRGDVSGARRPQYHAARKQREARERTYRIIIVTVCALLVAGCSPRVFAYFHSLSDDSKANSARKRTLETTALNPLQGQKLYIDPNSNAARQAAAWRLTQPENAAVMDKLAALPSSQWYSDAITFDKVHTYVQAANDQSAMPVMVAYFIPDRDCDRYSTGGAPTEAAYYDYIDTYAKAIGSLRAIIILEPDALVHTRSKNSDGQPCLDARQTFMYYTLLSYAVDRFKSLSATVVYIDAGNTAWEPDAAAMVNALRQSGIDRADGFTLNVSNFQEIGPTIEYGEAISQKLGNKHFVIDTSRNGTGPFTNKISPAYNWCNPPGRALGHYPTVATGIDGVDAYLYIKNVGESDGTDADPTHCYGGPAAGTWWPEYAVGLVQRWPANLQPPGKP